MKAKYGHGVVDVWCVSLREAPEPWVADFIARGQLKWSETKTRGPYIQGVGGIPFLGLIIAFPGDYLVFDGDNIRAVTPKAFKKAYQLEERG